MSEPKHTPGPWRLTDDSRRVVRGRDGDRERSVCIIEPWTTEPDAALIAAAPDLASACERALLHVDHTEPIADVLRAALTKAGLR